MLIPVEWLKEHVELPAEPQALADRLTETGNEIEEIRTSPSGPVFYLKLTPNRPDMLSIRGAAREIAALYETGLHPAPVAVGKEGPEEPNVSVEIEAPDLCPRYVGLVVRGVRVGPSPAWLVQRLEAAGMRSVSNVVDATNYVMLEMGQPLHAFDLHTLGGTRIRVRRAAPGESLVVIDGTRVELQPEMLVIADADRPVAIAGVMGGRDTEVTDATTDILLESAYFDPTSVRRTAKRTGIATAASYRFERGVDRNDTLAAAERAATLIVELAGGVISRSVFDVCPRPHAPAAVPFRPARCRALLGVDIADDEAEGYLQRLGICVQRGPQCWSVTPPAWRPDLAIEEDIIEEVGRLYGYDRLPETLPGGNTGAGALSDEETFKRRVRSLLTAEGLNEAVGNTLVSAEFLRQSRLTLSPAWCEGEAVPLRNPLSEEFDTLRPSLLPGLLLAARHNFHRGQRDLMLFEVGYGNRRLPGAEPSYGLLVAGLVAGNRWTGVWNLGRDHTADFFTARGVAEALARGLGVTSLRAQPQQHSALHPGRTAGLFAGEAYLGVVGELHPEVAEWLDLPRGLYLFELDAVRLQELVRNHVVRYQPPSRFPLALRDLAVVLPENVASGEVEAVLRQALGEGCRSVRLFDVYQGKGVPEGRASLAYAIELGADDRTLTDEEVEARLAAARAALASRFGAEFRG